MPYSFEYLSDVAIADAAFIARGSTLEELFVAAALATTGVMLDAGDIRPVSERRLSLEAESKEDLLYNWLSELIYVKDVEYLVFGAYDLSIAEIEGKFQLSGLLRGERIDQERHRLGQDVKAVTYHLFGIWEDSRGFQARVVLDI